MRIDPKWLAHDANERLAAREAREAEASVADPMTVQVESISYNGGTIATGYGTHKGKRIVFAGDYRPMLALAEAIKQSGPVAADVPSWAILHRGR